MADERSTHETYQRDSTQRQYDENYARELLPFISGKVLDIGCGVGMFARIYAEKIEVESVIAVDKFEGAKIEYPKIKYVVADVIDFVSKLESRSFDTVVATEFVEHITEEQMKKVAVEVIRVIKKGGIFCGSTPIKNGETTNPYHLKEYTMQELRQIMPTVDVRDVGYNCMVWTLIK